MSSQYFDANDNPTDIGPGDGGRSLEAQSTRTNEITAPKFPVGDKNGPGGATPAGDTNPGSPTALISNEAVENFRTRWNDIQGKFVDEPRSAVQQADALVSEVVSQITQTFANEHSSLEAQWNQGNEVSTEDLRRALQRYRTFFNRLVILK